IPGMGLAKNCVCVGATDAISGPAALRNTSSFSSWGPADDGRIKPDLVAMGEKVYAAGAYKKGDSVARPDHYDRVDGTSFATPTAAGIGALLVELFNNKQEREPTSAEIKAVLVHTAMDAGEPGPDLKFGWGIINALAAGRLIAAEESPLLKKHVVTRA